LQKLVLLFGFYGGLRTSELTELRWNDIELTEQGIKVTIRHSKTDPAGNGHVFIIPSNKMDASVCPVNLLSL
jgi:integrase